MGVLMILLEVINYKAAIRDIKLEWFATAIGVVFLGVGIWLGSTLINRKPGKPEKFDGDKLGLSKREIEVLELMAQGYSNQEVADKLFVSLNTTKTHISNIYGKMNVKRRTQAVQKARDMAIITTEDENHPKG